METLENMSFAQLAGAALLFLAILLGISSVILSIFVPLGRYEEQKAIHETRIQEACIRVRGSWNRENKVCILRDVKE